MKADGNAECADRRRVTHLLLFVGTGFPESLDVSFHFVAPQREENEVFSPLPGQTKETETIANPFPCQNWLMSTNKERVACLLFQFREMHYTHKQTAIFFLFWPVVVKVYQAATDFINNFRKKMKQMEGGSRPECVCAIWRRDASVDAVAILLRGHTTAVGALGPPMTRWSNSHCAAVAK